MDFLSIFRQPKLRKSWTYAPGSVIWSVRTTQDGFIVGEERDQQKLQARFFCLDAETGRVQWEGVTLPEPWWTGIDGIHQSVIFFHEFAKPDLPEHVRIHAVDSRTGDLLWSNQEIAFWFAFDGRVYATRMGYRAKLGLSVDVRTGGLIEEYGENLDGMQALRQKAIMEEAQTDSVGLPEKLDNLPDSPLSEKIRILLKNSPFPASSEAIIAGDRAVVSAYEPVEGADVPLFRQRIWVIDEQGRLRFEALAHAAARMMLPDTYFVRRETLYYIESGRTLTAVRLTDRTRNRT